MADYQFLHSTYVKTDDEDCVVACVKDIQTNESKLEIFPNPKRRVFITRKGMRETHNRKKEFEWKQHLEEYTVPNLHTKVELQRLLGYNPKRFMRDSEIFNNPYVYGASIDIEVLIKQKYAAKTDRFCSEIKVGGLDIETSVLGGGEIILFTYTSHANISYCGVLSSFLKNGQTLADIRRVTEQSLQTFSSELNSTANKAWMKNPPQLVFFESSSELEVIKWVFAQIHREKDDFIGIWNIGYDIPYILKRLKFHNVMPEDIFCHPEVPKKWRRCEFKEDNAKVAHYSHKWSVFSVTGYSQFYDQMCLYSRLRKVDGNLTSYKLKDIAKKVLGTSKLDFGEANHRTMQTTRFVEYGAYNVVDSLLIPLNNKVLNDVNSMLILIPKTTIPKFAKQTAQLMDIFHDYALQNGAVSASCKGSLITEYDEFINNIGGGVLSPSLLRNAGAKKLIESNIATRICMMVSDLDVVLTLAPCYGNVA